MCVFKELLSIIKHSNNAYSDIFRDFLHYHSQEKTVQKGVSTIFKSALDLITNISPTTSPNFP